MSDHVSGATGAGRPGDSMAEIEAAFAPLAGRRILDIGCGPGRLVSALVRRGAIVTGVDPEPGAVAEARALVPDADIRQAGAEALPFADAAFDGAIFLNSLHHVPLDGMDRALAEALRVVGPAGTLLVIEPLPQGPFFEALRPLEDETAVRLAAQDALAAFAAGLADLVDLREWDRVERFASLDVFLERIVAADPARRDLLDAARPEIARRFEAHGEPGPQGRMLVQPMRMHRFRQAHG